MSSGWLLFLLCLVTFGAPSSNVLALDATIQAPTHPGSSAADSSPKTTETGDAVTTVTAGGTPDTVTTAATEPGDAVTMETTGGTTDTVTATTATTETGDAVTMETTRGTTNTVTATTATTETGDAVTMETTGGATDTVTATTETGDAETMETTGGTTDTVTTATTETGDAVTTETAGATTTTALRGSTTVEIAYTVATETTDAATTEVVRQHKPTRDRVEPSSACSARGRGLEDKLRKALKRLPTVRYIGYLKDNPDFLSQAIKSIRFVGFHTFHLGTSFVASCKDDETVLRSDLFTLERVYMSMRLICYDVRSQNGLIVIGSNATHAKISIVQTHNCSEADACLRVQSVRVDEVPDTLVEIPGTTDKEREVVQEMNLMFPRRVEETWKKCLTQALEESIGEALRP